MAKEWTKKEFEQHCYEAYQLAWMISHGYSLHDYLLQIAETDDEARYNDCYPEGGTLDIYESLNDTFEDEMGFNGSLWVCKDEFLGAEYLDESYMDFLFDMMMENKEDLVKAYTKYR